ncbi:hypothetical protein LXL04_010804 [Taraxacum kok-saghyz]
MEIILAIMGPIVESVLVPVKRHVSYLFSSTQHVRKMDTRIKQLDGTSIDAKKKKETNITGNLEIPTRVPDWLEEVEDVKKRAHGISSTGCGCFNMKMRYRAGRNAFKITKEIVDLDEEYSKIIWNDTPKPLGKVNSKNASTSGKSNGDSQNDFRSREKSFNDALSFLQQDHTSQVIGLCGMGGVGKTTMMEQLKKATIEKKTFDYVVKVVIGQQINMFSVQQAVAEYMGQPLNETSKTARADRLRITFEKLPEGRRKVLVILDDVWESFELKEIGLSPFPKGFKLLLTSRNEKICTQIGVKANLVVKVVRVDVMEKLEANHFFFGITGDEKKGDHELNQLGSEIVKRCGFLPLAIKLIAATLKLEEKFVWRDTLQRLKENNLDKNVQEIIEISYDYLKEEEEKAVFLLCGLFPDDYDIPVEELTRYAWGLRLLHKVSTLREARDRTRTCVQKLKNANLVMDSDCIGCVKMHDLVLSFALDRVSKGDHPWVINHGDTSKLNTEPGKRESCKSISVTCRGMSEFPRDFWYPNVSLLRLMHGDKSFRFRGDFYQDMKNLHVIAYAKMQYPLLPRSLECSTTIRTLLLQECSLMFDCSTISELSNLEVLSFAHCRISYLPSAIGKLKQLKLLDLTGSVDLRIDDGVLRNLVKLEELYMIVGGEELISFTDKICDELAGCSEHLSALEVEFRDCSCMLENMVFSKLERFSISVGMGIKIQKHSDGNTLKLLTNKDDLLKSRLNELFEKTEVLHLQVDDMNDIQEVLVESARLPQRSFYNLKVLDVLKCENLRYLFTTTIASGLMKLERLTVSKCPALEVLVYSENWGDGLIKFQALKFLTLKNLPKLVAFCNNDDVIELPQLVELTLEDLQHFTSIYPENTSATSSMSDNISLVQPFFNKEVLIPKLETVNIKRMDKLKEIWPYEVRSSDEVNACMLRKICVENCENLVNLFPRNLLSLLRHLEELDVYECGNIEVLFNIDMSSVFDIKEYRSNLRRISVRNLGKLRELWRMKCESSSEILACSFQAIEKICIDSCESFINIFTPPLTNPDVRTFMNVSIDGRRHWEESGKNIKLVQKIQERLNIVVVMDGGRLNMISVISEVEISEVCSNISDAKFSFNHLEALEVKGCKEVEVMFEIGSSSNSKDLTTTRHNHQPLLLPYLKRLDLENMERMSHVWKCNWNRHVIPQNQSQSSFHNLTNIRLENCHIIKYLFSPLMGKLLPNLKNVFIEKCAAIKEVVSNGHDEMDTPISTHTNTSFFPCLEKLFLDGLPFLKSIDGVTTVTTTSIHDQFKIVNFGPECGGSKVGVASWFLCQYSKQIEIYSCPSLSRVFPSYVVGQLNKLEELRIIDCESMVELFEIEGVNNAGTDNAGDDTCTTITIPNSANMIQLPNITILHIDNCEVLEYVFTSSILASLKQLKELAVAGCKALQVIVKEDGSTSNSIVFRRLKSLTLGDLPNLKGFFLGMNEFRWPLLEYVQMYGCPEMVKFTSGHSVAPQLTNIHTGLGKHSLECGLNFHFTNAMHKTQIPMYSHPDMIKLLQFPWSFSNLVEVDVQWYNCLEIPVIFPCNELHNLKNLEKIYIHSVKSEDVFKVADGTKDDVNSKTQSVVVLQNLKEVTLDRLDQLRHMWKSSQWMVLHFPNLTKVSIEYCPLLEHIFTDCMVGSLLNLQELQITYCWSLDVIVKQAEDSKTSATEVVFPSLKTIRLHNLPNLKGFHLGKEAFQWPSLDTLEIKDCPEITVFTCGQSTTPELKRIDTTFGMCYVTEDPNSFIKTKQQEI